MLYRFFLSNYTSFKSRNELSLVPNKGTLRHVYGAESSIPVLKSALIYGPNASGKSNIIKAIDFSSKVVLDNSLIARSTNRAFKLDGISVESPTVFIYEFRFDDHAIYQYGFALQFKQSRIIDEWLIEKTLDGNETIVFSKQFDESAGAYEVQAPVSPDSVTSHRYDTYAVDWTSFPGLILTDLVNKKIEGDAAYSLAKIIYNWFERLIVIFPTSEYMLIGAVLGDMQAVNELYNGYFKKFDIDIEQITLSNVGIDSLNLDQSTRGDLKLKLTRDGGLVMLHRPGHDYVVELSSSGDLSARELAFVHGNGADRAMLSKEEESDGTNRMVDLIPLLASLRQNGQTAIVDEIDRSLHCLLTREFLQQFYRETQGIASQLICTTHDVTLLNPSIVNREEVWFVSKRAGQSSLYPLNRYKLDDEALKNIGENYMLGRFSATPNL